MASLTEIGQVDTDEGYTSIRVLELVSGLSYRQLDYAVRTGRIRNRGRSRAGRGCPRLFSAGDVAALRFMVLMNPERTPGRGSGNRGNPRWVRTVMTIIAEADIAGLGGQAVVAYRGAARLADVEAISAVVLFARDAVVVVPCAQLTTGLI